MSHNRQLAPRSSFESGCAPLSSAFMSRETLSLARGARAASGASRGGDLGTLDGRSLVARGTRDAVREAELASRLSVWVSPRTRPLALLSRARVTL